VPVPKFTLVCPLLRILGELFIPCLQKE
jgi:hypothetical protein